MDKILLVIDYQNDFVNGALGFDGAELLDDKIATKIKEYGKGRVFYTQDTHYDDYLSTREGKNLPIIHCIDGTFGWEIFGDTKTALEEVCAMSFKKTSFGLDITDEIRKKLPNNVDEIEIVGLVSNICVISNAVIFQTIYPNAQIVIDANLTASFDNSLNDKTLDVLKGLQVKILNR